jgi:hypothetical protein
MTALDFPTSPSNGDTYENYVYDGAKAVWRINPQSPGFTLESLLDTSITTPADNEVLAYDNASGDWINQTASEAGIAESSHTHTTSDITDIVVSGTPADNEVLAYDSGSGDWINQTASEAGIAEASHTHTTSDITDIATYVSDNAAPRLLTEVTAKTANYTLTIGDLNKVVPFNSASTRTLTVPTDASVAFPIGSVVNIYNLNTGNVNIVGASGVTVRNAGALAQYGEVSLRKRGTNEWVLAGAVS